jgi:hypothetical protein
MSLNISKYIDLLNISYIQCMSLTSIPAARGRMLYLIVTVKAVIRIYEYHNKYRL